VKLVWYKEDSWRRMIDKLKKKHKILGETKKKKKKKKNFHFIFP